MKLSNFGKKFSRQSGINLLMVDLGEAYASKHPDLCMLGGGNPASIPEAQALFGEEMEHLIEQGLFEKMVGIYDGPQGERTFLEVLSQFLNREFGWDLTAANISLTNGSQNSFFYLFNALAGEMPDGGFKKILFPLSPEYVGYADSGLSDAMFASRRPKIELLDDRQFKYRVDFDQLEVGDDIAAICLSRPTNPTGNVVSDAELAKLHNLALQHDIPLIVDNAYGQPFPNVIYTEANIPWSEHTILCMSLSKLGLPGARTGIVIASEAITQVISSMSGIITLAPNSVGASLMTRMIESGKIKHLTEEIVKPFYRSKLEVAIELFNQHLGELPVLMHKPEGAFFLWLWLQDLPIPTYELYERLKRRHVYVIPGEEFFIDIDPAWDHTRQCLRINYAQPRDQLQRGFKILAEELRGLYR
ncbi:MAG: valine--pyruvate transaminase [Gammaproteobacteria bacterium]|nr:valine--pyruvate transaminase [Gammaproteobacteria bacterium]